MRPDNITSEMGLSVVFDRLFQSPPNESIRQYSMLPVQNMWKSSRAEYWRRWIVLSVMVIPCYVRDEVGTFQTDATEESSQVLLLAGADHDVDRLSRLAGLHPHIDLHDHKLPVTRLCIRGRLRGRQPARSRVA